MPEIKSYREMSKVHYGHSRDEAGIEAINAGSLQRIADATEKMAQSYDAMTKDRDWYKSRLMQEQQAYSRMERRVRALRGVITRMRKKAQIPTSPGVVGENQETTMAGKKNGKGKGGGKKPC